MGYSINKKKAHRLYQKSWNEADKKDLPKAILLIEEAIVLDPKQSLYWTTKANYLKDHSKPKEAYKAAQQALDLRPKNFHALVILGLLETDENNFKKAGFYFKKAIKIRPDYNVYTLLATVELHYDINSAITSAKKALEIEPNWDEAENILSIAKKITKEDYSKSDL